MAACDPSNTGCVAFLSIVAPLLGNIIALGLNLSPLRTYLQVMKTREIGPLNPMFAVMMVPNSLINLGYGFILSNWWIAAPNITGVCIGMWYSLILFRALPFERFRFYSLLLAGLTFITVMISSLTIIQFVPTEFSTARLIQGITATCFIVLFYAAPLSTMYNVIKEKDSSSIHIPISLVMLLNAAFWFAYGVFLHDPFVYGPNVLGMASAAAQITMALIFPRTKAGGKSWLTIKGHRYWKTLGRPSGNVNMTELESGAAVELNGEADKAENKKDVEDAGSERTETASERVDTPTPLTAEDA